MGKDIRKSPVTYGAPPYNWNVKSIYQCTWYAFYRSLEKNMTAPCYWDRNTKQGTYTNAKDWLANYREPWVVKGLDYKPCANDIVVFNGNYGHVAFIEEVNGDFALLSQYMNGNPNSFSNYKWQIGTNYTGSLFGYLHYDSIEPVSRNTQVDQVEVTDSTLRIRTAPSLTGDIVGFAQKGFYNVSSVTGKDGYTWYEIEDGRYIANVNTNYYPANNNDIVNQIQRFAKDMQGKIDELSNEDKELRRILKEINSLSEVS